MNFRVGLIRSVLISTILVLATSIARAQDVPLTPDMYEFSDNSITGVYVCTPRHVESGDCSDVDKEYYDNLARMTLGAYEIGVLQVNGERTIAFKGPLSPGAADNLIAILRAYPEIQTLTLSSQGGSEEEAFKIADYVKAHSLKTWVPVRRMCLSACVSVFLSGREMILDGLLGLHTGEFFLQDPYQIRNLEAARETFSEATLQNNRFMMRKVRQLLELNLNLGILDAMIEAQGDFLVFTTMDELYSFDPNRNYVRSLSDMSEFSRNQPARNFEFEGYQKLY